MSNRTPTACDSAPAKQALLAAALQTVAAQNAVAAFRPLLDPSDPASGDPSWVPGPFEYAAAVRANLPAGLAAGDFDGVNVAQGLA